jgi:3-oxoadipate enol-lactonase
MQVFGDDGTRIDVRVDGFDGDALVMIHGFPLTRDIWDAQAEALARTHRVVRPDLRGMGASSVPDGPYLMETLASDIAATLDALAIERAALVGHSLGGYVALAFVRMYTERVTHLALVCSRIAADTQEIAENRRKSADSIEREERLPSGMATRLLAPETLSRHPDIAQRAAELSRRVNPRGAAAMLRGMALRTASEDIAPDVNVPVLVVAGERDAIVPMDEARAVARAFPKGHLVVCERSGHLPMLEEPDRVSDALAGLLTAR